MESNTPSPEVNEAKLLEVLASLNQISDAINHIGAGDVNNSGISLQLIVESAIRVVPGSSAVIYTYDQATGRFETESRLSAQAEGHALSQNPAYTDDAPRPGGIGIRTIERRRRTLSYEEHDLDVHPYHAALGVNAVGCFPLIVAEQAVGILYIYLYEKREFTKIEQLMLDNFVNQAAMAIFHARHIAGIKRNLAQKENELNRLRHAGMLISSRLRLEETLESILEFALELTNAQYGIFRLLDKSGEFLVTKAVSSVHLERPLVEKLPIHHGASVMAYVARTRQPLLIRDLREKQWAEIYYPLDSKLEMRSELCVPLINASGRLEGVLNLESPNISGFDEDDSHMLQSLATYAITAIQEVRLLDALQEAAQLLISQPSLKVLDQLCIMAADLLNSSSSGIWLNNEQGQLQLASFNGVMHNGMQISEADSPNVLAMPLRTGNDEKVLGMFGVFYPDTGVGRSAKSEWDNKVLACLANYAVLAVQNESRQQALRQSQEQHWTAETFAAVGDISANLLHNMNNKVGSIPVRVQGIQDKYSKVLENDVYLTKSLSEIERSAMEAMQIVQENLSHLRPIRMEKIRIAACVSDAIRSVQVPPTLHFEVEGLDTLPMVLAGGQSLTFVFKNLIENASSAMNGSGNLEIRGHAFANWVEVFVVDDGPGVSPELHNQIFELNFSARAGSQPGKLGFGLWWVKTLMTRLGGSVVVESDGQHGATFVLRLPRMENS